MPHQEEITRLLEAHAGGDRGALDALLPLVYDELRRIASGRLRRERDDHTLNTTALVHEAYLELVKLDRMTWQSRAHFFAVAAQAMRNILVDYAVRRKAQKRGGAWQRVDMERFGPDGLGAEMDIPMDELLALDDALKRLEAFDPRAGQVVVCRFFAGLSIDETAHVLGISPATVSRDWTFARAWLNRELSRKPA